MLERHSDKINHTPGDLLLCALQKVGRGVERGGGTTKGETNMLEEKRRELLGELHTAKEKLDCLDYLRYQYQK